MYTAIIVDDEVKICQLIRCLGNWEEFGIRIVDVCQDGESAYDAIVKKRPDIVLTDIRMPVYDGLEILKKAREQGLDSSFIIISGYREFEYAKLAIQYGVVDFLVKPVNGEDLNLALKKSVEEINERRQFLNMGEMISDNERNVKESFLAQLADEKEYDGGTVGGEVGKVGPLFKENIFQAVIIKTNKTALNMAKSKFSEEVLRYLEEMLRAGESVAVAKEDGVYLLLNYRAEDYENVLSQLREVIKRMKRESDIYGQFAMTIALGKQVGDIGGMRESILTARAAWQQRMLFHNNEMIAYDRLKMDAEAFSMWDDREWSGFCEALESCDQNRISVFLNGCRKKVQEIRNLSLESLFEQIRKITMEIEYKTSGEERIDINRRAETVMEELRCCDSPEELFMHVNMYASRSVREYYDRKIAMKKLPILKAEEFLSKNYMKEISLEDMASLVDLSPAYFSKLFKSVEGVNYIDYLTQVRMDRAKELLKNTDKPINAIALETGYVNEKYFRKLFKKMVGIKPSEYRKLN